MDIGVCAVFLNKFLLTVRPDSPAFDAKSYYEQLITTSSLSTLLKKENELLSGSFSLSCCQEHFLTDLTPQKFDNLTVKDNRLCTITTTSLLQLVTRLPQ